MIRRALLLASLFLTSSAFAHWNPGFGVKSVSMAVGQTTTIILRASWNGWSINPDPFQPWICASDDPGVALVEGGLATPYGPGEVKITAIAPGIAYVNLFNRDGTVLGGPFVKIDVRPSTIHVSIAASASPSTAGRPLTLVAISTSASLTFAWYNGHVGDTSHPLQGTGDELTVQPTAAGRYFFWVSATSQMGMSTDEITIDVEPAPRRRAVGPR
jgi:hypothetical protein